MVDKDAICNAIYSTEVKNAKEEVKKAFWFDKIILTSGKFSICYVDHRVMTSASLYREAILSGLREEVLKTGANHIASSERAGVYWGSVIADRLGLPFCSMGKDGRFCGVIPYGAKSVGVDDLNTTLGTVLKLTDNIRAEGGDISKIIIDIDREEYLPQNEAKFKEANIELISLVTLRELIDYGVEHGLIEEEKKDLVTSYRENPDQFAVEIIQQNPEWVKNHDRLPKAIELYKNNDTVRPVLEEVLGKKIREETT